MLEVLVLVEVKLSPFDARCGSKKKKMKHQLTNLCVQKTERKKKSFPSLFGIKDYNRYNGDEPKSPCIGRAD